MPRWAPDTKDRLAQAALELYLHQGYPHTTVAQIAARAGTTERTFFRHFSDKSEVIFGGNTELQTLLIATMKEAPASATPLEVVCTGLEAAGKYFHGDTAPFRQRQALVSGQPELTARELHKMATLSEVIAAHLKDRGVGDLDAELSAELGIVVFKKAYQRWLDGKSDWKTCVRQTLTALRQVIVAAEPEEPPR